MAGLSLWIKVLLSCFNKVPHTAWNLIKFKTNFILLFYRSTSSLQSQSTTTTWQSTASSSTNKQHVRRLRIRNGRAGGRCSVFFFRKVYPYGIYTVAKLLARKFSIICFNYFPQFFYRKVYGILMIQLAITVGFIALFVYEPSVKQYSREHSEMWWIAFAMTFILLIVLACCSDFRRRWPLNIILLGLFTLCEGFMLGAVSSLYQVYHTYI